MTSPLETIKPDALDAVRIQDVSINESYGRRFLVKSGDAQDKVIFHTLYQTARRLANEYKENSEALLQIKDFVNRLKVKDKNSQSESDKRAQDDFVYRFRTFFHRLFNIFYGLGSHQDRLDELLNEIQNHQKALATKEPENFLVPIEKIRDFNGEVSIANFAVNEATINGTTLELLISQQSQKDPEVRLLQEKKTGKLYLDGGKTDPSISIGPNSSACAPDHKAKLLIDLSPLQGKAKIEIFEKIPGVMAGHNHKEISPPSEAVFITITNFTEVTVSKLNIKFRGD